MLEVCVAFQNEALELSNNHYVNNVIGVYNKIAKKTYNISLDIDIINDCVRYVLVNLKHNTIKVNLKDRIIDIIKATYLNGRSTKAKPSDLSIVNFYIKPMALLDIKLLNETTTAKLKEKYHWTLGKFLLDKQSLVNAQKTAATLASTKPSKDAYISLGKLHEEYEALIRTKPTLMSYVELYTNASIKCDITSNAEFLNSKLSDEGFDFAWFDPSTPQEAINRVLDLDTIDKLKADKLKIDIVDGAIRFKYKDTTDPDKLVW